MIKDEGGLLGKRKRGGIPNMTLYGTGGFDPSKPTAEQLGIGDVPKLSDAGAGYLDRFGFRDMILRNRNLVKLIDKPEESMKEVEATIADFANKRSIQHQEKYQELLQAGFTSAQAIKRADKFEDANLNILGAILMKKYPYYYGGGTPGSSAFNVLAMSNTKARKAQKIAENTS